MSINDRLVKAWYNVIEYSDCRKKSLNKENITISFKDKNFLNTKDKLSLNQLIKAGTGLLIIANYTTMEG